MVYTGFGWKIDVKWVTLECCILYSTNAIPQFGLIKTWLFFSKILQITCHRLPLKVRYVIYEMFLLSSNSVFFHHNYASIEISFCFHSRCLEVITMKLCSWHNSCAVMTYAKFCGDMIPYNGVVLKPIFHRIWITLEKSLVKWALDLCSNLGIMVLYLTKNLFKQKFLMTVNLQTTFSSSVPYFDSDFTGLCSQGSSWQQWFR